MQYWRELTLFNSICAQNIAVFSSSRGRVEGPLFVLLLQIYVDFGKHNKNQQQ